MSQRSKYQGRRQCIVTQVTMRLQGQFSQVCLYSAIRSWDDNAHTWRQSWSSALSGALFHACLCVGQKMLALYFDCCSHIACYWDQSTHPDWRGIRGKTCFVWFIVRMNCANSSTSLSPQTSPDSSGNNNSGRLEMMSGVVISKDTSDLFLDSHSRPEMVFVFAANKSLRQGYSGKQSNALANYLM